MRLYRHERLQPNEKPPTAASQNLYATMVWARWGWEQTAGTAMGFHGWLAVILGVVFTIIVGCGLMGLMFYSSRYGYDERASSLSDRDKNN